MFIFFGAQTVCFGVFSEKGTPGAAHGLIAFIFLFYAAYEYVFPSEDLYKLKSIAQHCFLALDRLLYG